MKTHRLSQISTALVLALGIATSATAQETSSSIRGYVVSQAGEKVSDATIVVTDSRTGVAKTLQSNATGDFSLRGLRVGGPYTIVVNGANGTKTIENVFLNLGETFTLDVNLEPAQDVERIAVVGVQSMINTDQKGPSSHFSFEELQLQPSVSRDIKDVIANDPRITIDQSNSDAIQCGGANNRFNSITVDGIKQNDNFGLNNNGYPTERLPFPFDAIDQVAVELAPFDVQYGGFTGCNVNAVIRSGTNEFTGSVFMDYTSDSLQGDTIGGNKRTVPEYDEKRYGFTFGAPIIEDTLFIFAGFEKHEPTEIFSYGPEGQGFGNPISGLTTEVLDRIRNIAQTKYGYQVGDIATSAPEKEEKIILKVDWYINDDHRTSLTYQNTDGNTISSTGTGRSSYAFNDRYYERANELTTFSAQLFSDWTADFTTELRIGKAEVKNGQKPFTSDASFGDVTIFDAVDNVDVFLGADQFRQANILNYDTTSYKFSAMYFTGEHTITAGFEYEAVDVFNLFVPGSQGRFEFDSLDDFENGIASRIRYANPVSLDANDGAAEFTFENTTLYVQDKWEATDDLSLTFGLRYDTWDSDDTPTANSSFEQRYGFTNAVGPDMSLLQPRFGFNYVYDDETFIYGGIGLFAGGNPNVWLSNNYSNNGVTILGSDIRGNNDAELAALNAANTANFLLEVPALSTSPEYFRGGDGAVNSLDKDFKVPAVWKYNVGIQREFDGGWFTGVDVIYAEQQDSAKTVALNSAFAGIAPDGRPIYHSVDKLDPDCASPLSDACSSRSGTDYHLTNSNFHGESLVVSAFVNKQFENGLKVSAGYAYMDAEEASPMNSSTASSNYGNLSVQDLNAPRVATSNYEVKHRFTANLSYKLDLFDDYSTRINLFAQRVKGKPYSYTFDGDPGFGDERGFEDRNLLYVPAGPGADADSKVVYGEDFDLDAFNQFIADAGLEGARGTILDRNTQNSNWWTRVDMRITQEIPGFMEGHKGSVFFSLKNLGNFLNDDWGTYKQVNFEYNNPVVDAQIDGDQYIYTNFDGDRGPSVNIDGSSWFMRVGIKYQF